MFARVTTMFAIFALTVITTVASAHAARMGVMPDQAMHVSAMTSASDNNEFSCVGEQHCGSTDAGICDFVCTGFSVFLTSSGQQAAQDFGPVSHDIPAGVIHAGWAPGLDERPPKLSLL
ncbi:hypothetical protein [Pseudoruegeria sp. SK021]|uniref:hypothetical protein n=1 Tax=Pseudoruegeria sp. SK021 TaxID=1933035 RepID=UPI000A25CC1D|nr:hypothetical protein [Pseudoruegeria sp. SK021]OSP53778.1 hypothetical protein BV911_16135 [Pseudoruegeria sp. SK021]